MRTVTRELPGEASRPANRDEPRPAGSSGWHLGQPSRSEKLKARLIFAILLLLGFSLVAAPFYVGWRHVVVLWVFGIPLSGITGYMLVWGIVFRIRHRTPEERAEYREHWLDRELGSDSRADTSARTFFAYKAAKGKDRLLNTGIDGTAVVRYAADVRMGRGDDERVVYLELDVTVGDKPVYQVRTGEFVTTISSSLISPGRRLAVKVDPSDPRLVAIDSDRSYGLPETE